MNLADAADELGAALGSLDAGLRVFPYPQPSIVPPAVCVGWPYDLDPNATVARGAWSATFPVLIAVGKADLKSARDTLTGYLWSLRSVLRDSTSAYDAARWTGGRIEPISIAGIEYLAAVLDVEVIGRGGQ